MLFPPVKLFTLNEQKKRTDKTITE